MKKEILILGAGPAGMAAAFELYRKGKQFTLVEKSGEVGGLSKTYQFGNFRTDNGPHRFFSKNNYLYEFIGDLLGEKWIKVTRFTRFFIQGSFFNYPIEIKNVLQKIGLLKSIRAIFDFGIAKIKFFGKKPKNFEEYAVSTFGKTIADLNVLNYTEKIWGIPCSELSVDWADQRIKDLSIWSIIKSLFIVGKNKPKTLVDEFYYPDFGTGLIYEAIKTRIEQKNEIILNTEPVKILHKNNLIKQIEFSNSSIVEAEKIVSSIPITTFINLLEPKPSPDVLTAISKLKYRAQVYLFITLNQPNITKDQWIYFPDKEIPFGRISEMKNFSEKMSPKDKTSLFVEFFCWEGDNIWNMNKEDLLNITMNWFEKFNFLKKESLLDSFLIKQKCVYPVYDLTYKENLNVVKNYLNKFSNLIYIGRPGRFKYTNQDHSLEMGILAARSILENKKFDIENVGEEKEYFEKGNVK